jgi:hypothetical protein
VDEPHRIGEVRRARRLARVLCSDLVVYGGDQIRMGLEKDDLFDRLAREIEQARVFYRHRVDASLERLFDWALVDVLVYANRRVSTHIW